MNELQKDKITQFVGDEVLLTTIKQLFSEEIDKSNPKVNDIDNDMTLGQKYRAYIEAKSIVSKCFYQLETYKTFGKEKESFAKHR